MENYPDSGYVISKYLGLKPTKNLEPTIYKHRPEKIYFYLNGLKPAVETPKTEAQLEIDDNFRAVKFLPSAEGLSLNLFASLQNVLKSLETNQSASELVMEIDMPTTALGDTNNLGIVELIASGESDFRGSPKNRIHNIKIGMKQMQGVIIKPGEEFSFNKFLGPVEEENGFLPELVIKKTGTVPELGGGLCQVSSTTFRAAMKAGLPIKERKNHAYAVQYYSPQGTDATIYPGVVDLKFLNDTPGHLLIWPYFKNSTKLIFDFYGTPDNRKVTLLTPRQYDKLPDGSLKAEWIRLVEKDGKVATSTYKSIYLSPALFHKELAFPTTTPPIIN